MHVAVLANEFFDVSLGRMGGFGWVATRTAQAIASIPGFSASFVTNEFQVPGWRTTSHGLPLITVPRNPAVGRRRLGGGVEAVLSIDFRSNYIPVLNALPWTPYVMWVQDPRTDYDNLRVTGLRLPDSDERPQGAGVVDCRALRVVARRSRLTGRRLEMPTHAEYLHEKVESTYGVRRQRPLPFLPDPLVHPQLERELSSQPTLVFLGRTDPIKRPWLFVEMAREMPEAQFVVMGQSHFSGSGSWRSGNLPDNIEFRGHVAEAEKFEVLRHAWLLVNTSVHEALPISYLEALSCEVPIVGMQNPDELCSRFGSFVGRWPGDGLAGVAHLVAAARSLIADDARRTALGRAGSQWVRSTHSVAAFQSAFQGILRDLA